MAEYIHLLGAEDVARAGSTMQSAAADMKRAADNMDESLRQLKMFLDDWLNRLEAVLSKEG